MMKSQSIMNYIANLSLSTFMSFSFAYALISSLNLECGPLRAFIFVFIFSLLFSVVFYNKLSMLISGLMVVLSIAMTVLYFVRTNSFPEFAAHIHGFFKWLDGYMAGYEKINPLYELYMIEFISITASLLVCIFTCKVFNFFAILASGTGLFVSQWVLDYFVSYLPFYVFLFTILIYYFRFVHSRNMLKESSSFVSTPVLTLWAIPVSAAVIASAYMIPASQKPLEWKWLNNKINTIIDRFNNSSSKSLRFEYFTVASSGFGDNGNLGGSVRLDKTLVLSVESPRVTYLKGSVRPTYTGYSWIKEAKSFKPLNSKNNSLLNDIEEMKTGMWLLSGADDNYLEKYFFKDKMSVTFENMRTKSLFVPSKTENIITSASSAFEPLIDEYGSLATRKTSRRGFAYSIDAYSPKYGEKDFADIMRKSEKGCYDKLLKNVQKAATYFLVGRDSNGDTMLYRQQIYTRSIGFSRINTDETVDVTAEKLKSEGYNVIVAQKPLDNKVASEYFSFSTKINIKIANPFDNGNPIVFTSLDALHSFYDKLLIMARNSEKAYSRYLQLPDNLPARVHELAQLITSSFSSSYDKAKAVEQYFSANNFPYTLTPQKTPRGQDFVDYFLFDLKEGYCTYFASAMTVLLRSAGIPARYVEGYILPSYPDTDNIFKVTNEQAHAWVEAYFEGFGWLVFEPTPPFASALYYSPTEDAYFDPGLLMDPALAEYLNRLRMYGQSDGLLIEGADFEADAHLKNESWYKSLIIMIFTCTAAIILIFVMGINFFRNRIMMFKCRRMNPRKGIINLYRYYIKILSAAGINIKPGETPFEFAKRVDSYFLFYNFENFKAVTDLFVVARYGNIEISDKDRKLVYNFYEHLKEKSQKEMGRFIYFIKSYLLGKL